MKESVGTIQVKTLTREGKFAPIQGVAPNLLLQQVRNTVPFIFQEESDAVPSLAYLSILKNAAKILAKDPNAPLNEDFVQYFGINLAAHYATVASFVPTDVDNQIRFKIWQPRVETSVLNAMADLVINAKAWNTSSVSARILKAVSTEETMSGHNGEWFSVAAAAYGATKRRLPEMAKALVDLILDEIRREFRIFEDHRQARDGHGLLKAATIIAHNLGDLNRVIDMWTLSEEDYLRTSLNAELESKSNKQIFADVSGLNRGYMADENHRHYPLRVPKCLRVDRDLLLPIGPFFDDWGKVVGKHEKLSPKEIGEVVVALIDGWLRLGGPVGYSRALSGIQESFPGGYSELKEFIPARTDRLLRSGALRSLCSIPQVRFDGHWRQTALKFLNL